jgi:hypothetical protein
LLITSRADHRFSDASRSQRATHTLRRHSNRSVIVRGRTRAPRRIGWVTWSGAAPTTGIGWSGAGSVSDDLVVTVPARQVRAKYSADTIIVYQAYPPEIAEPALAAGRFVAPFKRDRMTWVKPSFLWMMYRCGWATEPGQEHVLAIEITRSGFERALARAYPPTGGGGPGSRHRSVPDLC